MADDRLPMMLQVLRISIGATGELAVGDGAAAGSAPDAREPRSVLRDSHGHTYLLFGHRGASRTTGSAFDLRRRAWFRTALFAVLWAASVAGAVAAALRWGVPVSPF
jgi:hypothetical protein